MKRLPDVLMAIAITLVLLAPLTWHWIARALQWGLSF